MKTIKQLLFIGFFMIISMIACSREKIEEVVLKSYEDGSPMNVIVYKIKGTDSIPLIERKFHKNGAKFIEGYFKLGLRDSTWTSWRPDGIMWSQKNYNNGVVNGPYFTFYPNGLPYIQGQYLNGKESGVWKFNDENGILLKVVNFDTSETLYDAPEEETN